MDKFSLSNSTKSKRYRYRNSNEAKGKVEVIEGMHLWAQPLAAHNTPYRR